MKSNNVLIAEFMGLAYCTKHLYEGWYKNAEFNYRICGTEGLKYHTSWEWLMLVVEKIESMSYRIAISTYSVIIQKVKKDEAPIICFPTSKGDTFKREATYEAVVEFIKWYNNKS